MLAETRKVCARAGITRSGTRSKRAFQGAIIPSARASAFEDPGVGKFDEALEDCAFELLAEARILSRTDRRSSWTGQACTLVESKNVEATSLRISLLR